MSRLRPFVFVLVVVSLALAACTPGPATGTPAATSPAATLSPTTAPEATRAVPDETAAPAEPGYIALLRAALAACAGVARNQVCYGQGAVEVTWQPGAEAQPFAQPGDVVDLAQVAGLSLGGDSADWGVAVLSLEAGLPTDDQNLTVLALGPAELNVLDLAPEPEDIPWTIAPATGEESADDDLPNPLTFEPLQRLALTTGAPAEADWPTGLLMWTPWEGSLASFALNGATIYLGSTALVEANPAQGLTLATLEGTGVVISGDTSGIVPPGGQGTAPTDAEGTVTGPVADPVPMDPRAAAISAAVAQYGVVAPDPRAEAISAAVAQYRPELAEPDPWMDRVLVRAYAGWLERAARRCATLGGTRGARYVYNTLYWDTWLDRMGSDAFIDEVLGQGARARLDDLARRCLTFELDFGSRSEAHAEQLTYIIDLESEGVPLHFEPTGFLSRADPALVTHAEYEVIGEETRCSSELMSEDGTLTIHGMLLRIKVNTLTVLIDYMADVPREFVRYYCPTGNIDVPLSWEPIFGGAYGEMTIPETGAIRFADWRVTQGEHFAETIEDRSLPVDGADVDITTYFVLTHTPLPPP